MKKFTIKLVLLFFTLYILHCTFFITPVSASEDIGVSRISPASYFYFLKTIRENLELKLAFTPRIKMLRQLEFATRRLREAKTLIPNREDLIPPTLERYISYINNFADKHEINDQLVPLLEDTLATHLKVLRQMYDQVSSKRAKMFIRSTMYRLVKRADVQNLVKAPICKLFAKEASSSVLNQTEKFVLSERARNCL